MNTETTFLIDGQVGITVPDGVRYVYPRYSSSWGSDLYFVGWFYNDANGTPCRCHAEIIK